MTESRASVLRGGWPESVLLKEGSKFCLQMLRFLRCIQCHAVDMTLDECTEEIATYSRQNHELPEGLGWRIHTEHMHEYRVRKTQFIKLQTIEATKENHPKVSVLALFGTGLHCHWDQ